MSASPQPRLLADRLVYWATERGDAPALTFAATTRTWAEWHQTLQQLAGALAARGVGRGSVVATYDKNHPACLDLTLAASSIGAAHAIANWRLSPEEVAYVLGDSGAEVIFVGAEFMPVFATIREKLTALREVVVVGASEEHADGYEPLLAAATPAPLAGAEPGDTALIMYTSGTTGFPKGAMLTHRGMLAHSTNVAVDFDLRPDSIVQVAMPLFHVGGTSYALLAISCGARIELMRMPDPAAALEMVERERITHTFYVPALMAAMLQGC